MHISFRTHVRTLLTRSAMNQETLAEAMGYAEASYLSKLFTGKRPIRRPQVLSIITVLQQHDPQLTRDDADQLLTSAGFAPLQEEDSQEAALLNVLPLTDPILEVVDQPSQLLSDDTSRLCLTTAAPTDQIQKFPSPPLVGYRSPVSFIPLLMLLCFVVGWFSYHPSDASCLSVDAPPTTVAEYRIQAEYEYQRERYACAVVAFDVIIETRPTMWDYYYRGVSHFYLSQYHPAIEDLTIAIEMHPTYDWAYQFRGKAYELLGQDVAAVADYQTVIRLNDEARPNAERQLADHTSLGVD
ncbi:MAG: hypothetical protein AAGF95_08600 [Chloroflexota bacterium]